MIPQLLLEEISVGEKNKEDYYSKYGKENLERELKNLEESNKEILKTYSVKKMQECFDKKINSNNKNTNKKNIFRLEPKTLSFAAAAVFVMAFALPLMLKNTATISPKPTERVKGGLSAHHQIHLYREENGGAVQLKNGESAKENDLIQITYVPSSYDYGVIFSVDGNKNITRHFPENTWSAQKLEKTGEEVPLSFAYALDNAPDYECFIFVASKEQFDLSRLEKIDRKKLNVEFLKKGSYLPENCHGSIFVLKKE